MKVKVDGDIPTLEKLIENITGSNIDLPPVVSLLLKESTMKIDFKKELGTGKTLEMEVNISKENKEEV